MSPTFHFYYFFCWVKISSYINYFFFLFLCAFSAFLAVALRVISLFLSLFFDFLTLKWPSFSFYFCPPLTLQRYKEYLIFSFCRLFLPNIYLLSKNVHVFLLFSVTISIVFCFIVGYFPCYSFAKYNFFFPL